MTNRPASQVERALDKGKLEAFATQVLARLEKPAVPAETVFVDRLFDISLAAEEVYSSEIHSFLALPGLTPSCVIDTCIPEVARRAGALWVADNLSFVDVTLGARMHALCKLLNDAWDIRSGPARLHVMVATAPNEQHMIGSIVLASQLRRWGCSVKVQTGTSSQAMIRTLANGAYDAVLISAANSFTLDSAVQFVSQVRNQIERPPRLVIGGQIAELSKPSMENTGADLITSDFKVALAGLGQAGPSPDKSVTIEK